MIAYVQISWPLATSSFQADGVDQEPLSTFENRKWTLASTIVVPLTSIRGKLPRLGVCGFSWDVQIKPTDLASETAD